jgi:hypothetical protein
VDALRPSYNEYRRLQQNPAERDAWLAADDKRGSRQALYNRLYDDYTEYQRLYFEAYTIREAARRGRRGPNDRRVPGAEGER